MISQFLEVKQHLRGPTRNILRNVYNLIGDPTGFVWIKISLIQKRVHTDSKEIFRYSYMLQTESEIIMARLSFAFDFTLEGFAKECRMLCFEVSLETSTGSPIRCIMYKAKKDSLSTITIPSIG